MALKLYNTLTRKKEVFEPLDASNVRMYVCGPTVYDFAHIGNARPVIVFDVLFRLLRHIYGPEHVAYVRNITDVDDKINARAAQDYPGLPLNEAIRRVTEKTEAQFHADMRALGALDPTVEPRATEHIDQMKAMIERLVDKGCAYVAEDHVLFHVASMPDYGKLSGRSLDEMVAGARVEVAPYKRDPMDFVLWKPSKPGEPSWTSPCGIAAPGRPGWHIECSAMADRWLWDEAKPKLSKAGLAQPHMFDIHGGGIDLVFPHHENEVAQSRCANATPIMAQVWMHNGFLQVEGEKMAKSVGNFVTVHELLQDWPGEAIRLNMLMTHYRQPLNWTEAGLREAKRMLDHWYELTADTASEGMLCADTLAAIEDDLNTPKAVAAIHELRQAAAHGSNGAARSLKVSAQLLGLLQQDAQEWADWRPPSFTQDDARIASFIDARNAARAAKNFKEADRIRGELEAMGIMLKDAKDPKTGELVTTWEVAR
ncbi:MAG: cysteine--tRNA ligase [Methyloceanibacter sp.]